MKPIIQAERLTVEYRIQGAWLKAVQDISLTIQPLEIHGLVGESGSGKSTIAMALMHYLSPNARIADGRILFDGEDLVGQPISSLRQIWGGKMGFVPQNPLAALNPSLTIGDQMTEVTQLHKRLNRAQAQEIAIHMLRDVKIADPEHIVKRYPHQLSGGMQQRVMIAMALSTDPHLLILDEPTTALDVTTQAVILDLFRELIQREEAAALYVSHDLGTVAQLCDKVTVLYSGEIMEQATIRDLYYRPFHPYTIGLLASLPGKNNGTETRLSTIGGHAPSLADRPKACVFANRCPVAIDKCHTDKPPLETLDSGRAIRCWRWGEIASGALTPSNKPQGKVANAPPRAGLVLNVKNLSKRFGQDSFLNRLLMRKTDSVTAVDKVSLKINVRSTLGLVGESGSGKTTLARAIVGLDPADEGEIELCEVPIANTLAGRNPEVLRNLRMVFQNPHDALNPYQTVGQAISRTLYRLSQGQMSKADMRARIYQLLEAVGLTQDYYDRYPNQLSGGEKQRIAIARAFAAQPALIIADEPTSSLDVSVQAVILNLLKDLRAQEGASYLFISHDLEVIAYLADWIVVMYLGEIVEEGTAEQVYGVPSHPYTEALISSIPTPDPDRRQKRIRLDGEVPSPRNKPSGCPFHTRCPRKIGAICEQEVPPMRDAGDGHRIRCHISVDELALLQSANGG